MSEGVGEHRLSG